MVSTADRSHSEKAGVRCKAQQHSQGQRDELQAGCCRCLSVQQFQHHGARMEASPADRKGMKGQTPGPWLPPRWWRLSAHRPHSYQRAWSPLQTGPACVACMAMIRNETRVLLHSAGHAGQACCDLTMRRSKRLASKTLHMILLGAQEVTTHDSSPMNEKQFETMPSTQIYLHRHAGASIALITTSSSAAARYGRRNWLTHITRPLVWPGLPCSHAA